jgi:ATP dependent DNA ligase domain
MHSGVIATVMKLNFNALPSAKVRFIEPMYALAVQKLPDGNEWLYEVKFDGYRFLAGTDGKGVSVWSRRGNLFTTQFPHIAQACERLPADTLLDGEIVALDESGRVSYNLLQHHRSLPLRLQEVISGGGCWEQYCLGLAPPWSTQHCSLPSRTPRIPPGGHAPSASIASGVTWVMP